MKVSNFTLRVIKFDVLVACLVLSVNGLHLTSMHTHGIAAVNLNAAINAIGTNINDLQANAEGNS